MEKRTNKITKRKEQRMKQPKRDKNLTICSAPSNPLKGEKITGNVP